jgi:hypothetical protein
MVKNLVSTTYAKLGFSFRLATLPPTDGLTDRLLKINTSLMGWGKNQKLDPMVQLFENIFI